MGKELKRKQERWYLKKKGGIHVILSQFRVSHQRKETRFSNEININKKNGTATESSSITHKFPVEKSYSSAQKGKVGPEKKKENELKGKDRRTYATDSLLEKKHPQLPPV